MKEINFFSCLYKYSGLILLFIMFSIALFSFNEYGVSWDEQQQRNIGYKSYDYVFNDDESLLEWYDRDYGVAFELPLVIIEKTLSSHNYFYDLTDSKTIYLMRHIVNHIFFLIGGFFLFLLIDFLYKNKLLAIVGFLLLILHPRLYSHSFFNTKDIPFLSMFIISMYYTVKAFDKKTIFNFIKLGFCIGVLINLRIMGVMILPCVIFALVIDSIISDKKIFHAKLIFILVLTSSLSLYITWPYLWIDPFNNFVLAFENMSRFRWETNSVLVNGELIKATELSWWYIPTWFSITTPIIYLLLGLFASLLVLYKFIKNPLISFSNSIRRHNLIFLVYFIAPVFIVIVLHSVLYDGWRQLYFIYPSFVLLIIYGLSFLAKNYNKVFNFTLLLLMISLISSTNFMVKNYPLQHVYFNNFFSFTAPEYMRENYELDYWGVSYRKSFEYILKNDTSLLININVANPAGKKNLNILSSADINRINLVSFNEASYFITNYRWHPEEYDDLNEYKFHSFKVGNNTVSQIFKLK